MDIIRKKEDRSEIMCVLTMQDGSHSKVKSKFVDIMWKEEDRSEIMCVLTMQDWSHSKVKSKG